MADEGPLAALGRWLMEDRAPRDRPSSLGMLDQLAGGVGQSHMPFTGANAKAYPVDTAPATWVPQPYTQQGFRPSQNIENREDEGWLMGHAGGLKAALLNHFSFPARYGSLPAPDDMANALGAGTINPLVAQRLQWEQDRQERERAYEEIDRRKADNEYKLETGRYRRSQGGPR